MAQSEKKGWEPLCALAGGIYSGGMLCRLFLTPGDAYAPVIPTVWAIPAACAVLLFGFLGGSFHRGSKMRLFSLWLPLLWLGSVRLPFPGPELLTGFLLGCALAVLKCMRKTMQLRSLLIGFIFSFCFAATCPFLLERAVLSGTIVGAIAGSYLLFCYKPLKQWRFPLILLLLICAVMQQRIRGTFPLDSALPPPPLFAASLIPTGEDKVEILFVTDRMSGKEKPLDALPYVKHCTVLSWRDFSVLCTTGDSAKYDLVAFDAAPGRSGAYKTEALRQGLLRTRKGGGVLVYPGAGQVTPAPAGAQSAVSLPWDENRYFAAAFRAGLSVHQEKLDDRLQQYQNFFDFELFPAGVFTALYHGTLPEISLSPTAPARRTEHSLPAGWWRYAAGAAICYYLLRLLSCRKERAGAIFAAQENAISFGLVVFSAILQGGRDFFSPVPSCIFFGAVLFPLLAFRLSAVKGVCLLTAGWLLPVCWFFPACAGDWRITVMVVLFAALGTGYSCFRQNRPDWIPIGSAAGQFMAGLLIAALLIATLQFLHLPLLPLAAAGCLILRAGVTLRS